jgi:hypothetical protein
LFFQLSDLGKIFEEPTEVIEGYAVMARDSHVMIYTEKLKLAFNYTEGRGLALQAQYPKLVGYAQHGNVYEFGEWDEVYRELSCQVKRGEWTEIILKLPKIIEACRTYKPDPISPEAADVYLSYEKGLLLNES